MLIFVAVVSLLVALALLLPFWIGQGGHLQAAASINSLERLDAVKQSVLRRFLEDERAFSEKRISKMAWEQRRQYLTNRYIDAARRLDYLQSVVEQQSQDAKKGVPHG